MSIRAMHLSTCFTVRLCLAELGSDGVSSAANEILIRHGEVRIGDLAEKAGLSVCQFERRFNHQVGMGPKLYARIARFEAALDKKARSRAKSWTDVCYLASAEDPLTRTSNRSAITA